MAYDRTPKRRLFYTYLLSAAWHGFYPGYYWCFLSAAAFTEAGRSLRRNLRPLFLASKTSKFSYDLLTFLATKFSIAYLAVPFVLLESGSSLLVYNRLYFSGHLGCLFAIYLLPFLIERYRESRIDSNGRPDRAHLKIH